MAELAAAPRPHRSRLLKNFYGLATPTGDGTTAPASSVTAPTERPPTPDPTDLNGKAFDGEMYLHRLLQENDIKVLLKTQCQFIGKIKELDSEMKTLVYENYEKFISASDIIKKMKSNVESMEVEMGKLGEHVTAINDQSSSISAAFSEKRTRIRELGSRHSLLRKLQFIFDLPNKLKVCMNKSQYTDAVRYFFRANILLTRYHDLPVFGTLEQDCAEVMMEIGKRIKTKMTSNKTPTHEMAACAGCLLALGHNPAEVWTSLISVVASRLQKVKQDALEFEVEVGPIEAVDTRMPQASGDVELQEQRSRRSVERMRNMNDTFLKEFCNFMTAFHSLFLMQHPSARTNDEKTGDSKLPLVTVSKDGRHFFVQLAEEPHKHAQRDMEEFVRTLIHQYFESVEGFLELPDNKTIDTVQLPSDTYIAVLDLLYTDVQREARSSEVVKKYLLPRGMSLVSVFLGRIVHTLFSLTKKECFGKINEVHRLEIKSASMQNLSVDAGELTKYFDEMSDWLIDQAIPKCVQVLRKFTITEAKFMQAYMESFQESVRMELQAFWHDVLDQMQSMSTSMSYRLARPIPGAQSAHNHPRTIVLLVLNRLCQEFQSTAITRSYVLFVQADRLWPNAKLGSPVTGVARAVIAGKDSNESMDAVVPEIATVRDRCRSTGAKLLLRFVEVAAVELSQMIRKSLETRNWLTMKEPRRPSKLWEQILEDMNHLDVEVYQLFAQSGDLTAANAPGDCVDGHSSRHSLESSKPDASFTGNHPPSQGRSSAIDSRVSNLLGTGTTNNSHTNIVRATAGGGGAGGLQFLTNIDKLFSEHVEIFGRTIYPENRAGIMHSLVKIILKALIELVRLRTLNKNGLQQLQVDVEFIRVNFWQFSGEEKVISMLLDEVVACAAGRCLEPTPMEFSVVEKILASSSSSGPSAE